MQRAIRILLIFVVALGTTKLFAQEDFSGDMVDTSKGSATEHRAKIYATKEKMRFEPENQAPSKAAVIVNFSTHMNDVLMPERKMYMEMPQGQGPGTQQWSRDLFRPSNLDDACSEWLKLPQNKGGSCKNLGSETVNGRNTVKFEGTNSKGETGYAWIDKKIAFPIKWQGKNDTWELQNIKEGSQPASLFEIPAGYQKFQMPAGMPNMQRPQ
jgi:hypothetical protein